MDKNKPFCPRCLLEESGKIDIKAEVERLIDELPEWKKTSKEEYNIRIEACSKCTWLSMGTCFKCGCYVEYRAAQKDLLCPMGFWIDI